MAFPIDAAAAPSTLHYPSFGEGMELYLPLAGGPRLAQRLGAMPGTSTHPAPLRPPGAPVPPCPEGPHSCPAVTAEARVRAEAGEGALAVRAVDLSRAWVTLEGQWADVWQPAARPPPAAMALTCLADLNLDGLAGLDKKRLTSLADCLRPQKVRVGWRPAPPPQLNCMGWLAAATPWQRGASMSAVSALVLAACAADRGRLGERLVALAGGCVGQELAPLVPSLFSLPILHAAFSGTVQHIITGDGPEKDLFPVDAQADALGNMVWAFLQTLLGSTRDACLGNRLQEWLVILMQALERPLPSNLEAPSAAAVTGAMSSAVLGPPLAPSLSAFPGLPPQIDRQAVIAGIIICGGYKLARGLAASGRRRQARIESSMALCFAAGQFATCFWWMQGTSAVGAWLAGWGLESASPVREVAVPIDSIAIRLRLDLRRGNIYGPELAEHYVAVWLRLAEMEAANRSSPARYPAER